LHAVFSALHAASTQLLHWATVGSVVVLLEVLVEEPLVEALLVVVVPPVPPVPGLPVPPPHPAQVAARAIAKDARRRSMERGCHSEVPKGSAAPAPRA
jgi:hypothetical protein